MASRVLPSNFRLGTTTKLWNNNTKKSYKFKVLKLNFFFTSFLYHYLVLMNSQILFTYFYYFHTLAWYIDLFVFRGLTDVFTRKEIKARFRFIWLRKKDLFYKFRRPYSTILKYFIWFRLNGFSQKNLLKNKKLIEKVKNYIPKKKKFIKYWRTLFIESRNLSYKRRIMFYKKKINKAFILLLGAKIQRSGFMFKNFLLTHKSRSVMKTFCGTTVHSKKSSNKRRRLSQKKKIIQSVRTRFKRCVNAGELFPRRAIEWQRPFFNNKVTHQKLSFFKKLRLQKNKRLCLLSKRFKFKKTNSVSWWLETVLRRLHGERARLKMRHYTLSERYKRKLIRKGLVLRPYRRLFSFENTSDLIKSIVLPREINIAFPFKKKSRVKFRRYRLSSAIVPIRLIQRWEASIKDYKEGRKQKKCGLRYDLPSKLKNVWIRKRSRVFFNSMLFKRIKRVTKTRNPRSWKFYTKIVKRYRKKLIFSKQRKYIKNNTTVGYFWRRKYRMKRYKYFRWRFMLAPKKKLFKKFKYSDVNNKPHPVKSKKLKYYQNNIVRKSKRALLYKKKSRFKGIFYPDVYGYNGYKHSFLKKKKVKEIKNRIYYHWFWGFRRFDRIHKKISNISKYKDLFFKNYKLASSKYCLRFEKSWRKYINNGVDLRLNRLKGYFRLVLFWLWRKSNDDVKNLFFNSRLKEYNKFLQRLKTLLKSKSAWFALYRSSQGMFSGGNSRSHYSIFNSNYITGNVNNIFVGSGCNAVGEYQPYFLNFLFTIPEKKNFVFLIFLKKLLKKNYLNSRRLLILNKQFFLLLKYLNLTYSLRFSTLFHTRINCFFISCMSLFTKRELKFKRVVFQKLERYSNFRKLQIYLVQRFAFIFIISLKFKQFFLFLDYIKFLFIKYCRKQYVIMNFYKLFLKSNFFNYLANLIGFQFSLRGKMNRRPRARRILFFKKNKPALQRINLKIHYFAKQFITYFGSFTVKFWLYYY